MGLSEKDHILIEKHLAGQLTETEQRQFLQRKEDAEFSSELQFQQDLKIASRSQERDELRRLMRETDAYSRPSTRSFASNKYRRILAWSAAAILLLISVFVFLLPVLPGSESGFYSVYYEPYPNTVSPLTKGGEGLPDGFQLYELGRYEEAIRALSDLPVTTTNQFYLGLSYLGDDQMIPAIAAMQGITDRQSEYFIPAQWYLALAHLKEGELDTATRLLEGINQTDHALSAKAAELLEDLQ